MLIYIEGNIGSGKSTFNTLLKEYLSKFESLELDARVILEPVDEWLETKDSDGKHILEKFYGDQEKWAFAFQMNSFISRVHKIQQELNKEDNKIIDTNMIPKDSRLIESYLHQHETSIMEKCLFVERSIYTDRHCFAKLCYENKKMTKIEYDIYCKWNDWLSDEFEIEPDAYIYLRCLPNVNSERIEKRNRDGEEGIPIEYLEALHQKHEEWIKENTENQIPVFTVDVTENIKDPKIMNDIVEKLFEFVKKIM